MNEITVLQKPGNSNMVVFTPEDDRFTKMKIVEGISGETKTEWFILKKDTPLMIASWEADKYRIINY